MKALIRNPGETVAENDGIIGINWDTGAPLTNPSWAGGSYVLVENYDPSVCDVVNPNEFTIQERGTDVNHVNTPTPETVTIDGKTYTKDELLALLNQTS